MPFAVTAYFDASTEQRIVDIWKKLADRNIDAYLYQSDNRPHIKLAMSATLDLQKSADVLRAYAAGSPQLDIVFKHVGIFPLENPIVFLGTAATLQILEAQISINSALKDLSKAMQPEYFRPGSWIPDCFLTVGLERSKLMAAIETAMEINIPFTGRITEIGVIEFHPAKRLNSWPLNPSA